jgi:hypothetical protein
MTKKTLFADRVIDKYDIFSAVPPQLNLNKKETVGSVPGFLASLFIMATVIAFSTTKVRQLINKENPVITQ